MKRLLGMFLAVAMMVLGLGTGCLISNNSSSGGECCYNLERCENVCDMFGICEQSCWFEEVCTDYCDGSNTSCYNDRDCSDAEICLGNRCERADTPSRGDAGLCQACETNADCADPGALCVLLGAPDRVGESVCTTPCAGGCPTGFECATVGGSSQCLPKPNAQQQRTCQGVPQLECVSAKDCGRGESCVNNKCVPPADAECRQASDCASGQHCKLGECVADDAPECTTRSDCPSGAVCLDGRCTGHDTCIFNEDCEAGAMCVNGTCFSQCANDEVCGRYEHCRQGLCQPTECSGTADCAGDEVCVDATCKPACEPNTSSPVCGEGYVCTSHGYCDRDPGVQCRSNAECLRGEICQDGECGAPCTCNADCAGGEVCNADTGMCQLPVDGAPQTCDSICDCASGDQCTAGQCVPG